MRICASLSLVALVAACAPPQLEMAVEVTAPIGTATRISWSTTSPSHGILEWGSDETYGQRWETDGVATDASHTIVGQAPLTELYWRVTARDADAEGVEEGVFTTQGLPASLPELEVATWESETPDPGHVLLSITKDPNAPALFSTQGHYIWWYMDDREGITTTQVLLSADRKWILYNAFDPIMSDPDTTATQVAEIVRVALDGSEVQTVRTMGQHHDFTELPDGTLAWIQYSFKQIDGKWIRGDNLVETAPDGTETQVWSAWDTLTYDPTVDYGSTGWTHCNAITYDALDDTYYLSARNISTILKISRSGQVLWKFGGAESDFAINGSRPFAHSHGMQWQPGGTGVLLFDNGEDESARSRAVEYSLDLDAWTAEEIWSYDPVDPSIWAIAFGNAEHLPSGNRLVGWGSGGLIHQVTPEGRLAWRLNLPLGAVTAYIHFLDDLDGLWE